MYLSFSLIVHSLLFRCEDPSLFSDPEDMITVAHLYCVSLAFRLAIGGVSTAISSGLIFYLVPRFRRGLRRSSRNNHGLPVPLRTSLYNRWNCSGGTTGVPSSRLEKAKN